MAQRIVIQFDPHPERTSHKVWIFAKALWAACRDGSDGWAHMPLGDVDAVTDRLAVTVTSAKRVRRTVKLVEELLREHFLDRCARVSVEDAGG